MEAQAECYIERIVQMMTVLYIKGGKGTLDYCHRFSFYLLLLYIKLTLFVIDFEDQNQKGTIGTFQYIRIYNTFLDKKLLSMKSYLQMFCIWEN